MASGPTWWNPAYWDGITDEDYDAQEMLLDRIGNQRCKPWQDEASALVMDCLTELSANGFTPRESLALLRLGLTEEEN